MLYWIDPVDAVDCLQVAVKPELAEKFYFHYERQESEQRPAKRALCSRTVLPITHILGKLPLVPVGDTGTFPHSMHGESAEVPGASCY